MIATIGVVALNEEKMIQNLLDDFLKQTYAKDKTEIILVDSISSDKTKQIMFNFKNNHENEYYSIKVLDNKNIIQAAGWNVVIQNSSGDCISRIDAHSHIPEDFIEKNIALQLSGEYVTGGIRPCLIEHPNKWKEMLLEIENSLFGSSISKSKHSNKKSYVSTMFHATYRKEVFDKVGYFNERLLRTEDNEMHYQIRKAGYKLCYDPSIVSYQYARSTLKKSIKQKFGNGYWIGITSLVCPNCLSIFHFAPLGFLLAIIAFVILATFGMFIPLIILGSLYFAFTLISIVISILNKKANCWFIIAPFLFLVLHVSYGIGTLIGLFVSPFHVKGAKR